MSDFRRKRMRQCIGEPERLSYQCNTHVYTHPFARHGSSVMVMTSLESRATLLCYAMDEYGNARDRLLGFTT